MLKRFSHISLSLLLLVSTMGFAVSKHYCGDALVEIGFNENADACCDTGSCCHNETQLFQLDEDFSVPQISATPVIMELVVLGHDLLLADETPIQNLFHTIQINNSPPPESVQDFLSRKQVFLL